MGGVRLVLNQGFPQEVWRQLLQVFAPFLRLTKKPSWEEELKTSERHIDDGHQKKKI